MKDKLKRLAKISVIKTFMFNLVYFGWGGVRHCYALVSRDVKLAQMNGTITSNVPLQTGCIHIGFPNVGIIDHKFQRSIWDNSGRIVLNGSVSLGSGARISNSGEIEFGNHFNLNANSTIVCTKKISFGDNVLISWDVLLMDTDFHKIYEKDSIQSQINPPREISIGDNVWIGCRCFIAKGANIKSGCVVAAQSKVSGTASEENAIIGDKMKTIKQNILWKM